jgi:hypothetical protein
VIAGTDITLFLANSDMLCVWPTAFVGDTGSSETKLFQVYKFPFSAAESWIDPSAIQQQQ